VRGTKTKIITGWKFRRGQKKKSHQITCQINFPSYWKGEHELQTMSLINAKRCDGVENAG